MLNHIVRQFYIVLLLLTIYLFIRRVEAYKYNKTNCTALLQFFAFFSLTIHSLNIYICEKDAKRCCASFSYRQKGEAERNVKKKDMDILNRLVRQFCIFLLILSISPQLTRKSL